MESIKYKYWCKNCNNGFNFTKDLLIMHKDQSTVEVCPTCNRTQFYEIDKKYSVINSSKFKKELKEYDKNSLELMINLINFELKNR